MKAAVLYGVNQIEIREVSTPTNVQDGELTSSPPWNGRGFLLEQAELLVLLVG
ncbi:hypothetical protein [Microseira wollei]|uniref:hypothetical protein n=1 Tax=Microseira wollei TaxID=467598 RepID=UPI001CFD00B5|nr:hypothetical protein [Microseira wollei]